VFFPQRYSVDQIARILPPGMAAEAQRSGREEITGMRLSEFVEKVHGEGGLCIAAHVDTDRGVRRAFRQMGRDGITLYDQSSKVTPDEERSLSDGFKDWLFSAGFDGIEVGKEGDKEHYCWLSETHGEWISIPAILTSDTHTAPDLSACGRVTYAKMTELGFSGLQQALRFPDTRLRFPSDLPSVPSRRIAGVEVISPDDAGYFKELCIAFSENLTCLIGPRGSGKSTIIEAIRYAFGQNVTLGRLGQPDLAEKAKGLQAATLTGCVVRVLWEAADGEVTVVESAYDPKQDCTTKAFTAEGTDIEMGDIASSGRFPLRLFGWSEIETLGREPDRQRELLDRLIPDLGELLEERNDLRTKLKAKRSEIEASCDRMGDIMGRNQGEIARYAEYKSDFDKLNTDDVKALFAGADLASRREKLIGKVVENAAAWIEDLSRASSLGLCDGAEALLADGEADGWWLKLQQDREFQTREATVRGKLGEAETVLKLLSAELGADREGLVARIRETNKAIREQVSEEASQRVAAELRRTAAERLQRVEGLRQEYAAEWKVVERLLEEWRECGKQLVRLQDQISGSRGRRIAEIETRLNEFSTDEMAIGLRFESTGDRSDLAHHLAEGDLLVRSLHGNYRANRWPAMFAAACTPLELADAILDQDRQALEKTVKLPSGETKEVDEDTARRFVEPLCPFGREEGADLPTLDAAVVGRVLKLGEVPWEDTVGVVLNGRPVESVSPGQRSSAMLPLIALAEDAPLIIDQPEDNLDNRLIGNVLVDILAALKEKRQILVATHNPNIVVSGDAEQVIVLEATSDAHGECVLSGSIDKPEVIEAVVEIMEGGKEAFLARRRRYGF
jgi:DNA repair ATPase RecN